MPRQICIAAVNGFLGRELASHFSSLGWNVIGLSRQPSQFSGTNLLWDGRTLGDWASKVAASDVVINLAGRTVNCRYTPENRRQIYDSRLESSRVIGQALAQANKPIAWLNAATATIYRHAVDKPQDEFTGEITDSSLAAGETTAPGYNEKWRFSVDVAKQWESALFDAVVPSHVRRVALRITIAMGKAGGAFPIMDRLARIGLGGTIYPGTQHMSWIHHTDLVRAVEWIADHPDLAGPINLAAPDAPTMKEFQKTLRAVHRQPIGLPSMRWMMEIGAFFLKTETELLFKSRWVAPTKLLQSGFEFQYPTWKEAATHLIHE